MVDVRSLAVLQGQILILVLAGILFRRKLVGAEFQRDFSTLMLDLILPCNIISSFQIELTRDVIGKTLHILLISAAAQLLALALGALLFRKADSDRQAAMKLTMICSNASFLGIPVAEGIWGAQGVLLASVFLIPQRVVVWTAGLGWYSRDGGKSLWKRLFTNPCMVAVAIGLVLMFTGRRLPSVLSGATESLGSCTTGLSMFLVGMLVAHVQWREFFDRDVLWLTALRLAIFPAVILLGCRLLHAEPTAAGVAVMLTAMPAGTTVAVLSARYRKGERYAADLVTVSSLTSLVTIPLWGLLLT